MFVDQVKIFVKGGDGGRGCVSFRREAFVPRGGPDGGAGGRGADVVLEAVRHQNTLLPLRYHTEFRARRGGHGGSSNRTGASMEPLVIAVPPGTCVVDLEGEKHLGEILRVGDRLIVARGGKGGRGNRSFLSNSNRAPRNAEPGETGEERWLRLDLKLLADVGLLGLPNAGKSTLLSRLSAARPKVADYPFTTLTPVLGVVAVHDETFVMADVPGIIAGAHEGAGLGLRFLRHVERTRVFVHVVDASGARDALEDWVTVRKEVEAWSPELFGRPQIVAATKRDACSGVDPLPALSAAVEAAGCEVFAISAVTGAGLAELSRMLVRMLRREVAVGP